MSAAFLVTGASRGIGEAIVGSLDPSALRIGTCRPATLAGGALPGDVHWIGVDFLDKTAPDHVASALSQVPDFSGLSGVVLAAGIACPERFSPSQAAKATIDTHLRVNLGAPLSLLSVLVARELLLPGASVVLVGSNLARRGLAGKVSYSAAKAGLEGATRALAHELGPQGIRVNTVAPGLVETDMTQDLDAKAKSAYGQQVPLGRIGQATDIARVVRFFLSEDAAYVSGQVLDVDGGWGA